MARDVLCFFIGGPLNNRVEWVALWHIQNGYVEVPEPLGLREQPEEVLAELVPKLFRYTLDAPLRTGVPVFSCLETKR